MNVVSMFGTIFRTIFDTLIRVGTAVNIPLFQILFGALFVRMLMWALNIGRNEDKE